MGNNYSAYINNCGDLPSNVCVIYAVPRLFYGINLPKEIVEGIYQVYLDVWKKDIARVKYYNERLIKFVPHKIMMYQGADSINSAKSKQMFCRFHKLFCNFGWSLANSPTLTFEYSLSSWFYYKDINPYMLDTGSRDNEFCAISLSGSDSFQLIDFPSKLQSRLIETVKSNWIKGIQECGMINNMDNGFVIKLNGVTWSSTVSGENGLSARYLVLCLIRYMSHCNWRLINSAAMKPDACDTLFFRNFSNAFNVTCPDTMPEYYFMLALMGNNYFSILGGDEYIKSSIGMFCSIHEEKGIQPDDLKKNYPAVILNSKIWSRKDEKELKTRRLMTLLFQDLASIGWLPTESIDCTRSIWDLSSIIFVRIQPMRMMYFCLCPKKFHGISLINAPEDVQNLIYNTFIQYYPIESNKIMRMIYGIGLAIKFEGDPFRGGNKFSILLFQQTLAVVISALRNIGWTLMLSADTSNETLTRSTGEDSSETIKYSIHGLWFAKVIM